MRYTNLLTYLLTYVDRRIVRGCQRQLGLLGSRIWGPKSYNGVKILLCSGGTGD